MRTVQTWRVVDLACHHFILTLAAPTSIRARDKTDKTSLDVFWLKDKSLTDLDNLPEPDQLAEEIIENPEAGPNSFRAVLASLK